MITGVGAPRLREGDVHIWYPRLDLPDEELVEAFDLLDPSEQARAEKFHFSRDRDRFVARRAKLRVLLCAYLDLPPDQIRYSLGPKDKPAITGCEFNASSSGGLGVIAVTRERQIGVDLEWLDATQDVQLLRSALSSDERSRFDELPEVEQLPFILLVWTYKEALVKAIGVGLAVTPQRFSSFSGGSEFYRGSP